uniref:Uncharacterized protein n=1 Tax=Pseudomonas phage Touem01 TaxID=3138548 RepID=A0AAU6W2Z0_9VIRU
MSKLKIVPGSSIVGTYAGLVAQTATSASVVDADPAVEENARRFVACWNVCDGISTEVLELNATAGGIATLERQRDNYRAVLEGAEYRDIEGIGRNSVEDSRLIGETAKACTLDIVHARDSARAQCHELISAFEEVLRISDRQHDAWDRARAAIAAFFPLTKGAEDAARRVSACLAACKSISTKALEAGDLSVLDLQRDRMVLTQQRDDLLAALEVLRHDAFNGHLDSYVSDAISRADAAIATAKGPQWKPHAWKTGGPGEGTSMPLFLDGSPAAQAEFEASTSGPSIAELQASGVLLKGGDQ